MSITVGDNFSYQGGKPLDARFQFSSVANMKAFAEASLYDGCLAYIPSSKKYYTYDSSNTTDQTTGKWRELETGGGGGTSDYNDLTNKPQIAGTTLSGNTSLATLGLTSSVESQSSGGTTKSYVSTGEKYNWNTGSTWYGTCSTSASTTAKSVTLARGTLNFTAGARIAVKFSYGNTASAPTLTVNGTVKNIKCIDESGSTYTPEVWWDANDIVEFVYDGTQFLMQLTTSMMFKIHGTTMDREDIYSSSEKVVGCWTDGRPLYQKTITYTMPSISGSTRTQGSWVSISSNINNIVEIKGYVATSSGTVFDIASVSEKDGSYCRFFATNNSYATSAQRNSLCVVSNWSTLSGCSAYVTLKYTKTTDAANSFKYGDPNDYSTTEKIVGSWVDGKPLYQKTINFGALPNSTSKSVNHGVSNPSIKRIFGYTTNGTSVATLPFTGTGNDSGTNNIAIYATTTQIIVEALRDRSAYTTTYITIQYTKS